MRIAIATISMARTDAEAVELSASLRELARHNLPVFVADRSSHRGFQEFLAGRAFTILEGGTNLVSQARLAIQAASRSTEMILYTEPDKAFFFSERLADFLPQADVNAATLPARSMESFESYSLIQRRVETAVNALASRLFGIDGDFTYGPMFFPAGLANGLENFPAELGWGWRMHLIRAARRRGIPIRLWEGDLPCPAGQNADTEAEWLHRMRQYWQNIGGLLHDASPQEVVEALGCFPEFRGM